MKDDVEKKLIAALEASDQAPNPHVLDIAKEEMRKKKASERHSSVCKLAIAGCLFLVLCLVIVLPIVLLHNGSAPITQIEIQTIEYASMQEYFDENGIELIAFSENPHSMLEEENQNYNREGCKVLKQGETTLFVQETYLYEGKMITLSVVEEDTEAVRHEYFSEYNGCDHTYLVSKKYSFYYCFYTEQQMGYAFTEYQGYSVYFKIECKTEQEMFNHFINYIGLQKN